MPGLTFQNQSNRGGFSGGGARRPGGWLVALVLVIICIAIITLSVRSEGGGVFAVARSGVQAVTKPIERVCSGLSTPFRSIGSGSSEELDQLKQENEQLKTLVAELEEYRQQNQRLSALVQLSDTYALATKSASVVGATSGWSRTATLDIGSDDGIRAGMGVISSCGLYGQIETVGRNTSVVRLITDSNSSVSAMIQGSRARGILSGSYDGSLTLDYIGTEYTVGEGDYVITSGDGGVYPNGIIIGTVKTAEPDPSKLYYRITVDPIASISSCQEVMVLTGDEAEVANIIDEDRIKAIREATLTTDSAAATSAIKDARTGTTESFTTSVNSGESGEGTEQGQQSDSNQADNQAQQSDSGQDTEQGGSQQTDDSDAMSSSDGSTSDGVSVDSVQSDQE